MHPVQFFDPIQMLALLGGAAAAVLVVAAAVSAAGRALRRLTAKRPLAVARPQR